MDSARTNLSSMVRADQESEMEPLIAFPLRSLHKSRSEVAANRRTYSCSRAVNAEKFAGRVPESQGLTNEVMPCPMHRKFLYTAAAA